MSLQGESPIENLLVATLESWANEDPANRYTILGRHIAMFSSKNGDEKNLISPRFLALLNQAPNKRLFIGGLWDRLHPKAWGGSLADILSERKAQLMVLAETADEQLQAWINEATPELDRWIERERLRDRASEESFE